MIDRFFLDRADSLVSRIMISTGIGYVPLVRAAALAASVAPAHIAVSGGPSGAAVGAVYLIATMINLYGVESCERMGRDYANASRAEFRETPASVFCRAVFAAGAAFYAVSSVLGFPDPERLLLHVGILTYLYVSAAVVPPDGGGKGRKSDEDDEALLERLLVRVGENG